MVAKKTGSSSVKQKNINYGQKGIAGFPEYGHFATFHIKGDKKKATRFG